jgi:hypothetical protein
MQTATPVPILHRDAIPYPLPINARLPMVPLSSMLINKAMAYPGIIKVSPYQTSRQKYTGWYWIYRRRLERMVRFLTNPLYAIHVSSRPMHLMTQQVLDYSCITIHDAPTSCGQTSQVPTQHSPLGLGFSHGFPVHVKPELSSTFPHRYSPAIVPLASVKSTSKMPMSVHGATALHCKLTALVDCVVPVMP